MIKFDKLVRDRIPEIAEEKGRKVSFHIAAEEEFEKKLLEKLKEETSEFIKDKNIDEMADIFEVITSINKIYGWTLDEVIKVQKEKRIKRGGFNNKIILDEVDKLW